MSENVDKTSAENARTEEPSTQLPATEPETVLEPGKKQSPDEKQMTLEERKLALEKKKYWIEVIKVFIAIAATVLALLAFFRGIREVQSDMRNLGRSVQRGQFEITSPQNGDEVGLGQKVRGNTQFFQMNHYIVVTPVSTGTAYLQKDPVSISPDGTFSGNARFGDKAVGQDDEFKIQALATKTILPAGILANLPGDAIFSEPVSVRRVKLLGQPLITAPPDGAEVIMDSRILGTTPLVGMKHYIIVTPVREGTSYVQDQPAAVNREEGTFSGRGRFGSATVGAGEQFTIRILATDSTLPAGPLIREPEDAVESNSITVRRRQ